MSDFWEPLSETFLLFLKDLDVRQNVSSPRTYLCRNMLIYLITGLKKTKTAHNRHIVTILLLS